MITREEIENLAALARIELGAEEKTALQKDVGAILEYVSQIQEVSARAGIPPLVKEVSPTLSEKVGTEDFSSINVLREDTEPHESGIYTEKLLSAAPQREGQYIKVKRIL